MIAASTTSTPTIATSTMTTTISIQQANSSFPQQQNQIYNRALSEPRYQSPPLSLLPSKQKEAQTERAMQQIETYDNLTLENEIIEPNKQSNQNDEQELDKHIYGVLETKDLKQQDILEQPSVKNTSQTENGHEMNNCENLKIMQKQLFDLTKIIHNAVLNGDLKQLATIECVLNKNSSSALQLQHSAAIVEDSASEKINYRKNLNCLLTKIRELKTEYQSVKKLHENFNSNINESMKQFVNKLQVRQQLIRKEFNYNFFLLLLQ